MDLACVVGLVEQVFSLRAASPGRDDLTVGLSMVERLARWVEAQRVELAEALAAVASFPDSDIAEATRTGLRDASRTLERVGLVEQAPAFREALAAGELAGAHVDVLGRALRKLEPPEQSQLLAAHKHWATVAGPLHTGPVRQDPGP